MEQLTDLSLSLFTLSCIGFALAYSVVLAKIFGKPIKAFLSTLF